MNKPFNQFREWIEHQVSMGSIGFSLEEAKRKLPMMTKEAISLAIHRQTVKGRIVSIYRGYYLIITPQYKGMGILPPTLFINELMEFIGKPYHVGLINAAVLHGATHQQPQEFYVVTTRPEIRAIRKKGIVIHFICQSKFNNNFIELKKTETGTIKVSNPEYTAIELIEFEKRMGGLSRVASILDELVEAFNKAGFSNQLILESKLSNLQRLGYLLDRIIQSHELAEVLHHKMLKLGLKMPLTKLKSLGTGKGNPIDKKWNIIINAEIETDL